MKYGVRYRTPGGNTVTEEFSDYADARDRAATLRAAGKVVDLIFLNADGSESTAGEPTPRTK